MIGQAIVHIFLDALIRALVPARTFTGESAAAPPLFASPFPQALGNGFAAFASSIIFTSAIGAAAPVLGSIFIGRTAGPRSPGRRSPDFRSRDSGLRAFRTARRP